MAIGFAIIAQFVMSLESCKTIYVAPSGPNCSLLPPVVIKLNQTHHL